MAETLEQVGGAETAPSTVLSADTLQEVVSEVQRQGAFCFDVETRGVLGQHPELVDLLNERIESHLATLKRVNEDIRSQNVVRFTDKFRKMLALDPNRNEVFWIGISTRGQSWAIPMGHNMGQIIVPAEVGDGSTVPPPGLRKILQSGKESMSKAKYYIPPVVGEPPKQLSRAEVLDALHPIFFDPKIIKVGHNVKFDARSIGKYYGEIPPGPYVDTMIYQHVLNENLDSYSLERLIAHNYERHDAYAKEGKLGKIIDEVPFDSAVRYVHLDVRWTWMLYKRLDQRIGGKQGLRNTAELDCQVLSVLMDMETQGMDVDVRAMKQLGKDLDQKAMDLLVDIYKYAPPGFNPDSNVQKADLLFTKKRQGGLGLKPSRLTPGGKASVDSEALELLQGEHPVVDNLIEWSETKKLKTTYVEGLTEQLVKGKLHPSFHLHRTKTGRLSSSAPNLQNIPRESSVRGLFVAGHGSVLLVADYDQIELRVMAMFSQDQNLIDIFQQGQDIHAGAAALLYGKGINTVTAEERQVGKGANFLTAYGGGASKLSRQTGLAIDVAQHMIDRYHQQFNGLTKWKRKIVAQARRDGYVTTMSGRRRRLPELDASDDYIRSKAERQAVNAVVQGSAADICKQAMIDVHVAFQDTRTRLLVQVHDELVARTPIEDASTSAALMSQAMGDGTVMLGVPLNASCHHAYSWSDAKGK